MYKKSPLLLCIVPKIQTFIKMSQVGRQIALTQGKYCDTLKTEKASALVPVMGTKGAFCFFKNINLGERIYGEAKDNYVDLICAGCRKQIMMNVETRLNGG